jgi:hypothetical protein
VLNGSIAAFDEYFMSEQKPGPVAGSSLWIALRDFYVLFLDSALHISPLLTSKKNGGSMLPSASTESCGRSVLTVLYSREGHIERQCQNKTRTAAKEY